MWEILTFYFQIMSKVFTDIFCGFEILPGIPFGLFLIGSMLFCTFLKILKFGYGDNGINEIKSFNKKREKRSDK